MARKGRCVGTQHQLPFKYITYLQSLDGPRVQNPNLELRKHAGLANILRFRLNLPTEYLYWVVWWKVSRSLAVSDNDAPRKVDLRNDYEVGHSFKVS